MGAIIAAIKMITIFIGKSEKENEDQTLLWICVTKILIDIYITVDYKQVQHQNNMRKYTSKLHTIDGAHLQCHKSICNV